MLIPNWENSAVGSPYSFSKAHLPPLVSANHHSASRTFATNQPSVTGVSPDPKSTSCASRTDRFLQASTSGRAVADERSLVRAVRAPSLRALDQERRQSVIRVRALCFLTPMF